MNANDTVEELWVYGDKAFMASDSTCTLASPPGNYSGWINSATTRAFIINECLRTGATGIYLGNSNCCNGFSATTYGATFTPIITAFVQQANAAGLKVGQVIAISSTGPANRVKNFNALNPAVQIVTVMEEDEYWVSSNYTTVNPGGGFTASVSGTTLTFSVAQTGIQVGDGIRIGNGSSWSAFVRIVSGSGTTWTITPSSTIAANSQYQIRKYATWKTNSTAIHNILNPIGVDCSAYLANWLPGELAGLVNCVDTYWLTQYSSKPEYNRSSSAQSLSFAVNEIAGTAPSTPKRVGALVSMEGYELNATGGNDSQSNFLMHWMQGRSTAASATAAQITAKKNLQQMADVYTHNGLPTTPTPRHFNAESTLVKSRIHWVGCAIFSWKYFGPLNVLAKRTDNIIYAIGDGAYTGNLAVAKQVAAQVPLNVGRFLYLGDIYTDGTATEYRNYYDTVYGCQAPSFHNLLISTSATLGNHEWPNRVTGSDPYWNGTLGAPGVYAQADWDGDRTDTNPRYYSFILNGWKFICIGSMEDGNASGGITVGSALYNWVQAELNSTTDAKKIVFGHHPRWSAGSDHGNNAAMQPLWALMQGRALAYISGHTHTMQLHKMRDVNGNVTSGGGVHQIIAGSGGQGNQTITSPYLDLNGTAALLFSSTSFGGVKITTNIDSIDVCFFNQAGTILNCQNLSLATPNNPPVVDAGVNQTITLPSPAVMSATVTDDGLQNPLTYSWIKISGPGTVTFNNASVLNPSVTFSSPGTYVLQLTANDGQFSVTDTVTITVNASPAIKTLTINSTNPSSGVAITVSLADLNGNQNGSTSFIRTYLATSSITLTAPITVGGSTFSRWVIDGVNYSTQLSITVSDLSSHTLVAVYNTTNSNNWPVYVNSSNPNAGVQITCSGMTDGITPFANLVANGTSVSLSAPTTAGGRTFQKWVSDNGNLIDTNHNITVVVTGPITYTAVYTPNTDELSVVTYLDNSTTDSMVHFAYARVANKVIDGTVIDSAAGATNVTTTITVASTTGILAGMKVTKIAGTGTLSDPNNTYVLLVTGPTTFTVTSGFSVNLSAGAVIRCEDVFTKTHSVDDIVSTQVVTGRGVEDRFGEKDSVLGSLYGNGFSEWDHRYTIDVVSSITGKTGSAQIFLTRPPMPTRRMVAVQPTSCATTSGQLSLQSPGNYAFAQFNGGDIGTIIYLWSTGAVTPSIVGLGAGSYTVTANDSSSFLDSYTGGTEAQPMVEFADLDGSNVLVNQVQYGDMQIAPVGWTLTSATYSSANKLIAVAAGGSIQFTLPTEVDKYYHGGFWVSGTNYAAASPGRVFEVKVDAVVLGYVTEVQGWLPIKFQASSTSHVIKITSTGGVTGNINKIAIFEYDTVFTATLAVPAAMSEGHVLTNPICNGGATGSIVLTMAGGQGAYHYVWTKSGSPGLVFPDSGTIDNLYAGSYSVVVSDLCSSVSYGPFVISDPAALVTTATVTDVTIYGLNNGSVSFGTTGGTGPYTYKVNGVSINSNVATGLAAGTYSYATNSANGCVTTGTFVVTQPSAPLSGTVTSADIPCNGGSSLATAHPVGGISPYTYSWDGGSFASTATHTYTAGSHTLVIKDANNVSVTVPFTITEPTAVAATATSTNTSGAGLSDGTITVTVTGGSLPVTTDIDTVLTTETLTFNAYGSQTVYGLVAGHYTFSVVDNCGIFVGFDIEITDPNITPGDPVDPLDEHNFFKRISCCLGDKVWEIMKNWGSGGSFELQCQAISVMAAIRMLKILRRWYVAGTEVSAGRKGYWAVRIGALGLNPNMRITFTLPGFTTTGINFTAGDPTYMDSISTALNNAGWDTEVDPVTNYLWIYSPENSFYNNLAPVITTSRIDLTQNWSRLDTTYFHNTFIGACDPCNSDDILESVCLNEDYTTVNPGDGFGASVSGTTLTFSTEQTGIQVGDGIRIGNGIDWSEWVVIVSGSGTTWTITPSSTISGDDQYQIRKAATWETNAKAVKMKEQLADFCQTCLSCKCEEVTIDRGGK